MQKIKKQVKAAIGAVAAATGVYRLRFRSNMLIVAFHRVSNEHPDDVLTCTSERFEQFCQFFREHFRIVNFSDHVASQNAPEEMGRTVSITFDDGSLDNYEIAAPILKKYGIPATFFVTTQFIGSDIVPYWDRHLKSQPGWMTWDHVRGLSAQGFDVGGHTETHINLATADEATIRAELSGSKRKLETELGKKIDLFAYPYGGRHQINARAVELVREAGFVSCASCHGGINRVGDDPFHLRRIGIVSWFSSPHQLGTELLLGTS